MTNQSRTRTALVTGAAQGIGRAITRRLLIDGYRVHALDQHRDALDELARTTGPSSGGDGSQLICRVCDVADESQVADCLAQVRKAHAGLDVLGAVANSYEAAPRAVLRQDEAPASAV